MLRTLNITGNLLFWGGLLVFTSVFEHQLGISRWWAIPIAAAGGALLLVRYFMRERKGEDV
jgi:hypothetical protein